MALTSAQCAVPFHVFVLVCDRDKTVAPRAAIEFQKIIASGPKRASPLFLEMLERCRESYQALWKDYAASKVEIDLAGFVESLDLLKESTGPAEFAELENDLAGLATTLFRASFALRPRPAQRQAYDEFMTALRKRVVPREAGSGKPERAEAVIEDRPRPVQTAPPAASRLVVESRPDEARKAKPDRLPAARATALMALPKPGDWWLDGPIGLVCTAIHDEARDVKTFSFASVDRRWFHYQPGQFLIVEPVIAGTRVSRSYTISSSPTRPTLLEITVKRLPGGIVSNWLHDHVSVGDILELMRPSGVFCPAESSAPIVGFCGGSGVTPVFSIVKQLLATTERQVRLLVANRDRSSVIFFDALERLRGDHPERFELIHHLDADGGYLDPATVTTLIADTNDPECFICGPTPFMDLVEATLVGAGVDPGRIAIERFIAGGVSAAEPPPTTTAPPTDASDDSTETLTIVVKGKKHVLGYTAGDTVLDSARRAGLKTPFSCELGNCGSCMALVSEGGATMRRNNALTPDEVSEGWVLTCQALPTGRVVKVEYENF